jgi:hypothetical protein
MFIAAALFTVAKLWLQTRCPTTDEWMKKMTFIDSGILVKKMNEILSFAGKWMEMKNISLR